MWQKENSLDNLNLDSKYFISEDPIKYTGRKN